MTSALLYVRVSRSRNQDGREPLSAFARRVAALVATPAIRRVAVDVRLNTGGTFHTTEPLAATICGAAWTGRIAGV
jgi:hypothetical protein